MNQAVIATYKFVKDDNKSSREEFTGKVVFIKLPGDLHGVLRRLYDLDEEFILHTLDLEKVDLADAIGGD